MSSSCQLPVEGSASTPAYEAKVGRASCTTTYFLTLATHGSNKTVCNMMLVRWGEDERNRSASLTFIRPSLSSPKSWRSSTSVVKLGNVFPLKRDTTGVRLGLNQLTASNPRCSLIAIRAVCEGVGFHLPFKARCLRLGALARTLQSIADRGSVICSIEKCCNPGSSGSSIARSKVPRVCGARAGRPLFNSSDLRFGMRCNSPISLSKSSSELMEKRKVPQYRKHQSGYRKEHTVKVV